jgi:hypothetical protein
MRIPFFEMSTAILLGTLILLVYLVNRDNNRVQWVPDPPTPGRHYPIVETIPQPL